MHVNCERGDLITWPHQSLELVFNGVALSVDVFISELRLKRFSRASFIVSLKVDCVVRRLAAQIAAFVPTAPTMASLSQVLLVKPFLWRLGGCVFLQPVGWSCRFARSYLGPPECQAKLWASATIQRAQKCIGEAASNDEICMEELCHMSEFFESQIVCLYTPSVLPDLKWTAYAFVEGVCEFLAQHRVSLLSSSLRYFWSGYTPAWLCTLITQTLARSGVDLPTARVMSDLCTDHFATQHPRMAMADLVLIRDMCSGLYAS